MQIRVSALINKFVVVVGLLLNVEGGHAANNACGLKDERSLESGRTPDSRTCRVCANTISSFSTRTTEDAGLRRVQLTRPDRKIICSIAM